MADDTQDAGPQDPAPAPQQQSPQSQQAGPGDPPISPELRDKVKRLLAAGVPREQVATFIKQQAIHEEYKSGALLERMQTHNRLDRLNDEADQAAEGSTLTGRAQAMLGGLATLGGQFPTVGRAQAMIRSLARGQSYDEALADIKKAEGMNPMSTGHDVPGVPFKVNPNQLVGGVVAAAAAPGMGGLATMAPEMAAGAYGVASGLGDREQMSWSDRLKNAAVHGATDFITAGAARSLVTGTRAARAGALDETMTGRAAETNKASDTNFDQARKEAQAAQDEVVAARQPPPVVRSPAPSTRDAINEFEANKGRAASRVLQQQESTVQQQSAREALERRSAERDAAPAIQAAQEDYATRAARLQAANTVQQTAIKALQHPDVWPYASDALEANPGSSPGDIIMSTYRRMSAKQGDLQRSLGNVYNEDQAKELVRLGKAKDALLTATDKMDIPGFRNAVAEHERMMSEQEAGIEGADVARRTMTKNQAGQGVPALRGEKVLSESPAAFRQKVPQMTVRQAQVAREDFLSRLHDMQAFSKNPLKAFDFPLHQPTETLDVLDARANQGTFQHGLSFPELLKAVLQTTADQRLGGTQDQQ